MKRGRGRPPLPVPEAEARRREYTCRTCSAPPGRPCRRPDGRPYTDSHADRHVQAVADGRLPLLPRHAAVRTGLRVIAALSMGDEHCAVEIVEGMPPEEADHLEQVAAALVRVCADARRPHQYGTDMSPTAVQTRPTP